MRKNDEFAGLETEPTSRYRPTVIEIGLIGTGIAVVIIALVTAFTPPPPTAPVPVLTQPATGR